MLLVLLCLSFDFAFYINTCIDEHGMLQIWDIERELCLHAQQLRKSPLLKIECSSPTEIIVTASDCVEVWNIEHTTKAKVKPVRAI